MKELSRKFKKACAVLTAIAMGFVLCALPVNAEELDTPVTEKPILRYNGSLIGSGSTSFSGGSGAFEIHLSSANWQANIMAGTAGTSADGTVSCYVKFPNGSWYNLGTVMASASHTDLSYHVYCPAGTYTFLFQADTDDMIYVYGRMYD